MGDVQHPGQGSMKLSVYVGDVVQNDGFVQQHLVERQREPTVQMVTVEHRQAHHSAHEVEIR